MESHDLGDILLMLLDDDLFPVEERSEAPECGSDTTRTL